MAANAREGRYDAWRRFLAQRQQAANADDRLEAAPSRVNFDDFTVENRAPGQPRGRIYIPFKRAVTYAPNQPIKSSAGGCKYGKHMEAGRIFCFRNPNHHKLPRGQADRSKQRTAAQITRGRNRPAAQEEDEEEAEPERIRGRGGMRTPGRPPTAIPARERGSRVVGRPVRPAVVPRRSPRLNR